MGNIKARTYRDIYMDRVRIRINQWVQMNPLWTPESLMAHIKFLIKHYGLTNRYLPPNFKKEDVEEVMKEEQKDVSDTPGTEATIS